ncbi:hypothetical protein CDAR_173221 [Caerostris darwini]|uniref:Uncharacterized protein n=1 Tax=Caerostris darwini TaxID=1538125 RepID=A0AAV4WKW2_9ARAC|nr:hypothetical protein CDAR_173221 [Caerostris darwini]
MRKEGQPIHSKCILVLCSTPGVFEESLSPPPPTERILPSAFKIPKGGMKTSLSIEDSNQRWSRRFRESVGFLEFGKGELVLKPKNMNVTLNNQED